MADFFIPLSFRHNLCERSVMKQLLLISLLPALMAFAPCKNKKKSFTISGNITSTYSYCGGARPTPEMEQDARTPKALAGKTIYLRAGEKNDVKKPILQSISSNDKGQFELKLAAGKYVIVEERKKDRKFVEEVLEKYKEKSAYYTAVNPECIEKWLQTPDFSFEIDEKGKLKSGEKILQINYHQPCSFRSIPCVSYTGPMPP